MVWRAGAKVLLAAGLLQVLPGPCWTELSSKQQQDAAAVLMR
jgi:hypothetical protein